MLERQPFKRMCQNGQLIAFHTMVFGNGWMRKVTNYLKSYGKDAL